MPDPIWSSRRALSEQLKQHGGPVPAHAGVVLAHCLEKQDDPDAKKRLYTTVVKDVGPAVAKLYRSAFEMWRDELEKLCKPSAEWPADAPRLCIAKTRELQTTGRLIVGLGCQNVLEAGIRLHHTYGTPIIPGSGLKGLAAHYCHDVWGAEPEATAVENATIDASAAAQELLKERKLRQEFRREVKDGDGTKRPGRNYEILFGTTEDRGYITFHDAWILHDSLPGAFRHDVMTPHHTGYYSSDGEQPPTDFDSPIPVSFLSVSGKFLIAVSCDDTSKNGQRWLELAFELLEEALLAWGAGGKTSSGYGRLTDEKTVANLAIRQDKQPSSLSPGGSDSVTTTAVAPIKYAKGEVIERAEVVTVNRNEGDINTVEVKIPGVERLQHVYQHTLDVGKLPKGIAVGDFIRCEAEARPGRLRYWPIELQQAVKQSQQKKQQGPNRDQRRR